MNPSPALSAASSSAGGAPPVRVKLPAKPEPSIFEQAGASLLEIAFTVGGMGILAGKIVSRIVTLRIDGAQSLWGDTWELPE